MNLRRFGFLGVCVTLWSSFAFGQAWLVPNPVWTLEETEVRFSPHLDPASPLYGGTGLIYSWPGACHLSPYGPSAFYKFSDPGTYGVQVTISNSDYSIQETASATVYVLGASTQSSGLDFKVSARSRTFCIGGYQYDIDINETYGTTGEKVFISYPATVDSNACTYPDVNAPCVPVMILSSLQPSSYGSPPQPAVGVDSSDYDEVIVSSNGDEPLRDGDERYPCSELYYVKSQLISSPKGSGVNQVSMVRNNVIDPDWGPLPVRVDSTFPGAPFPSVNSFCFPVDPRFSAVRCCELKPVPKPCPAWSLLEDPLGIRCLDYPVWLDPTSPPCFVDQDSHEALDSVRHPIDNTELCAYSVMNDTGRHPWLWKITLVRDENVSQGDLFVSNSAIPLLVENNLRWDAGLQMTVAPRFSSNPPNPNLPYTPVIAYQTTDFTNRTLYLQSLSWCPTDSMPPATIVLQASRWFDLPRVAGSAQLYNGYPVTWVSWLDSVPMDHSIHVQPFAHPPGQAPFAIAAPAVVNVGDEGQTTYDYDLVADTRGRVWVIWQGLRTENGAIVGRCVYLDQVTGSPGVSLFPNPSSSNYPMVLIHLNIWHTSAPSLIQAVSGLHDPSNSNRARIWLAYQRSDDSQIYARFLEFIDNANLYPLLPAPPLGTPISTTPTPVCPTTQPLAYPDPYCTSPGQECLNPYPAPCGSTFDSSNPVPGGNYPPLCGGASTRARWFQVTVPAWGSLRARVQATSAPDDVGIAFFYDCTGVPNNPIDSICSQSDISLTHINPGPLEESVLVRISDVPSATHPIITFGCTVPTPTLTPTPPPTPPTPTPPPTPCTPPQNNGLCDAVEIGCGTIQGPLTCGAEDTVGPNCPTDRPLPDVWYTISNVQPLTKIRVTFDHQSPTGGMLRIWDYQPVCWWGRLLGAECSETYDILPVQVEHIFDPPVGYSTVLVEAAAEYLSPVTQTLAVECFLPGSVCHYPREIDCGDTGILDFAAGNDRLPCLSDPVDARWLQLTVPANNRVTLTLVSGYSHGDMGIGVYTDCGNISSPVESECDTDDDGTVSLVYRNTGGSAQVVKILTNVKQGAAAPYGSALCVYETPTPTPTPTINNECTGAVSLSNGTPRQYNSDLTGATLSSESVPSCLGFTPAADVWYQITPNAYAYVDVEAMGDMPGVSFAVYQGDCGSLTLIDCADLLDNDEGAAYSFSSAPGTTYYLRLFLLYPAATGGTITATWVTATATPSPTPTPVPDGDNPATAIEIDCGYESPSPTNLMTGMTASGIECDCLTYPFPSNLRDKWYKLDSPGLEQGINVYFVNTDQQGVTGAHVAIYVEHVNELGTLYIKNCGEYYTSYVPSSATDTVYIRIGTTYDISDELLQVSCFDKFGWEGY